MQKTSLFEFLTEAIPSFYKYSERCEQRQMKISFPIWLRRTTSYLRYDKDNVNQVQKQIYLDIPNTVHL